VSTNNFFIAAARRAKIDFLLGEAGFSRAKKILFFRLTPRGARAKFFHFRADAKKFRAR
jgi:hypothetical protein